MPLSRRSFFSITSGLSALGISALATRAWGQAPPLPYAISGADAFPQQDPGLVKDAVGASHGNFARIRELVEKQPAMARASIDWGFGDWETCIDAAAHVGNKPIADFLLTHGAQADDLFGGDDGSAGCGEGVHRGAARHPEDARPARHHADVAREGRRPRCRRGRAVPRDARRCGHADPDAAAGAGGSRCARRQVRLRSRTARLLHGRRAAGSFRLASASIARTARRAAA